MSLKKFTALEKELQFKSVTLGDSEDWGYLAVWEDAFKQLEAITDGEVTFNMVTKTSTLEISINSNGVLLIESPDDNFDDSIIESLNEKLHAMGVKRQFYMVTPQGVEFDEDPMISIGYMNDQAYEKVATLGYGNAGEYDWTDDGVIWNAGTDS